MRNMRRIDMNKVAQKYAKYYENKTKKGEQPMDSGNWLWHVLDILNVDELLKDE